MEVETFLCKTYEGLSTQDTIETIWSETSGHPWSSLDLFSQPWWRHFEILLHPSVAYFRSFSFDLIWFDSIWFDSIWFDLIWFDLIWFDSPADKIQTSMVLIALTHLPNRYLKNDGLDECLSQNGYVHKNILFVSREWTKSQMCM